MAPGETRPRPRKDANPPYPGGQAHPQLFGAERQVQVVVLPESVDEFADHANRSALCRVAFNDGGGDGGRPRGVRAVIAGWSRAKVRQVSKIVRL